MAMVMVTTCQPGKPERGREVVDDQGVRHRVPDTAVTGVLRWIPGQRLVAQLDDQGTITALALGEAPPISG